MDIFITLGSFFMFFAGGVHFYWAFGGLRLKEHVIPVKDGGEKLFCPSKKGTALVGLALCCAASASFYPAVSGSALPAALRWFCAMCAIIFFFRFVGDTRYVGVFRRVRRTGFARYDALIFTPLSLFFCLTCLFAALYV